MSPNALSRILPLPTAAAGGVRSGAQIVSMADAIEEVVANSVDAAASAIFVTFDSSECTFTVRDDGVGITSEDIHAVATWHRTSKRAPSDAPSGGHFLGFRGDSLAAIAEMSVLSVVSRARGHFETVTKIVRGGDIVKVGVSADPRKHTGTTVSVWSFMYNRPVRRKALTRER